jgi:hypothetical protein
MLYHWYELDLESSDAMSRLSPSPHDHAENVRYNQDAAKAEACGRSCQIAELSADIIPANDTAPDLVAEQLRTIGIGSLCNPLYSAAPGDYDLLPQTLKRLHSLATWLAERARRLNITTPRRRRNIAAGHEHTIVSNDIDDHCAATDGARRQRFELAGQH